MKASLKKKLLKEMQQEPSGRSSPVFPWSPLPQRKHLNFIERKVTFVVVFTRLLNQIYYYRI